MIKFRCTACKEPMDAPESLAGAYETCPRCGQRRRVPKQTPKYCRPTEGQLELAKYLRIEVPADVSRWELHEVLSGVPQEAYPATPKQKEFARNLGIEFKPKITRSEMHRLLDKKLARMPPSEGQLAFARDLGIRVPRRCSYKRLSVMITEALEEESAPGYVEDWRDRC
jgi:hypothetical protein